MTNENNQTAIIQAEGAFGSGGSFELAQREAKAFCSSDLVPSQYRNNLPNALIALEVAKRLGASVLAVMQSLYVVNGRPAFGSSFLIATVNACGRFTPIRFRMEGKEGSQSWGCRAYATDKSTGEECVGPLISMAMAKAEGWIDKKGSKWQTMPEVMLRYRAAAFWQRLYAPELSLGMHTREEMEDVGPSMVITAGPTEEPVQSGGLARVKEQLKKKAEIPAVDDLPEWIEPKDDPEVKEAEPAATTVEPVVVPSDAFDVFKELNGRGEEIHGAEWPKVRSKMAKAAGFGATLTEDQAGILLDKLNEGVAP